MNSVIARNLTALFVISLLTACGGGSGGSSSTQSTSTSNTLQVASEDIAITAAGIKGPLAFADAKVFAFDPSFPDFYDENSPLSSAISNEFAEITGLSVPGNTQPPYIMTIGGANAIDLNTGMAPVITTLITVITTDMLTADHPIYATPLTTLVFHMARFHTGASGDVNAFIQSTKDASTLVRRKFSLDPGASIDVFKSPLVINDNTISVAQQQEAVHHRAALEAFSAKINTLASSHENITANILIERVARDLQSDGVIDNSADGETIVGIDPAILNQDPMDLQIPNTVYRIGNVMDLMEDERIAIGTDRGPDFQVDAIEFGNSQVSPDPVVRPELIVNPEPIITPDPVAAPYQQSTGTEGFVSIEASDFDANVSQGGKRWENSYPSGYSGTGALITSPNTGTYNNTGYVTNSPRLDYVVNFAKTGVHYVWVRGAGPTGDDDSLHVGLDGVALSSSNRISQFSNGLSWTNTQMGGTVAKINVATVGKHMLNVWMREDGTVFDKIVLTTNSVYTPANAGPPASVRSTTGSVSYEPIATLSSNRLNFGSQDVGGISDSSLLTLTNSGNAPLTMSGISISNDFIGTNDCNDHLPAGDSCSIEVKFVPTTSGDITGTLTFTGNDSVGTHAVSLTGIGNYGSQTETLVASGPIVISGESDVVISGLHISNPNGRCVDIRSASVNVIIENSEIGPCKDEGIYIDSSENITIRDTYIHDTTGVGIRTYRAEGIHVTSNQIERVASGVYAGNSKQVDVNNNYILNVRGPYPRGQIVQFAYVSGPGNRINNNIGINEVGESYAEDTINLYRSSGDPDDYIQVNGNILVGGGPSMSGGGILLGDNESAYAIADGNILVNPGATGIKIASGHHLIMTNNKVFSDRKEFTNTAVPIGYQAKTEDMICHSLEVSNNEITFWKGTKFLRGSHTEPYLDPHWKYEGCGSITGWGTNKFDTPDNQPANLDKSILPADLIAALRPLNL